MGNAIIITVSSYGTPIRFPKNCTVDYVGDVAMVTKIGKFDQKTGYNSACV